MKRLVSDGLFFNRWIAAARRLSDEERCTRNTNTCIPAPSPAAPRECLSLSCAHCQHMEGTGKVRDEKEPLLKQDHVTDLS